MRLVRDAGRTGRSTCRQCGARIVWALTDRDNRMPVDVQADLAKGNVVLWYDDESPGVQRVSTVRIWEQMEGLAVGSYVGPRWTSHFNHCPGANAERRREPTTTPATKKEPQQLNLLGRAPKGGF